MPTAPKKQALDATRVNAFRYLPTELFVVGHDDEGDDQTHPCWDERAKYDLDECMVRNIMHRGVVQAITVKRDGNRVVVVDGRQRVLHCREANRRLLEQGGKPHYITAFPYKGTEDDVAGVMISTTIHREDSIPVKARKAAKLMSAHHYTEEQVALEFGVTIKCIQDWMTYVDLAKPVQKEVERGNLSVSGALKLAPLSRDDQIEALGKVMAARPPPPPPPEKQDAQPTLPALENARPAPSVRAPKRPRITAKDVARAVDEDVIEPPPRRVVTRLLEHEDCKSLPPDFVRGIKWCRGQLKPSAVAGLTGILATITKPQDG